MRPLPPAPRPLSRPPLLLPPPLIPGLVSRSRSGFLHLAFRSACPCQPAGRFRVAREMGEGLRRVLLLVHLADVGVLGHQRLSGVPLQGNWAVGLSSIPPLQGYLAMCAERLGSGRRDAIGDTAVPRGLYRRVAAVTEDATEDVWMVTIPLGTSPGVSGPC